MTIFTTIFIFALGASAGAAIMGILAGGKSADLQAENGELRAGLDFDKDDPDFDMTIAKLKAIIGEPKHATEAASICGND